MGIPAILLYSVGQKLIAEGVAFAGVKGKDKSKRKSHRPNRM
jgi:hypothetical protein